jgi:S1-C subfamily serine protease
MGLELQSLDGTLAADRGLPEATRGALVVRVDPGSPFAELCRADDVIAAINDRPIQSAEQAARYLSHQGEAPLIISLDRPAGGRLERHVIRVP